MPVLQRGSLRLDISLDPFRIDVRRLERPLLHSLTVWACRGTVHDRFVRVTAGVDARERRGAREPPVAAAIASAGDDEAEIGPVSYTHLTLPTNSRV